MCLKVSILGATGYIGMELVRLLGRHPKVKIAHVTAETHAGKLLGSSLPNVVGDAANLVLENLEDIPAIAADSDVVFLALPHGIAAKLAKTMLDQNVKVIDASADFRLNDPWLYKAWYEIDHASPELLKTAVYGLPELNREQIRQARLVANPGCYPTATIIALAPFLREGIVSLDGIIVDAKSGVSGAGRSPTLSTHYSEVNENVRPYNVAGTHRHTPEIEQELSRLAGFPLKLTFTPHLIPMTRGILVTAYLMLNRKLTTEEATEIYYSYYRSEPFIRVLGQGVLPETKAVYGSNFCQVAARVDLRANRLILFSAIDNLVKGGAGQAVQNLNLISGFEETMGLTAQPMFP